MSHLWLERPVLRVTVGPDGRPQVVYWMSRAHRVSAIVEHWRENRRWWSRPRDRDTWQIVTETGLVMEIIYDRLRDAWLLQRVYD